MSGPRIIDSILDRLCAGEDVKVFVLGEPEPTCRFPQYTPLYSYDLGCRCPRCRIEHNARSAEASREARRRRAIQRATMRRIQWGHR
jgi:hypothetical protein